MKNIFTILFCFGMLLSVASAQPTDGTVLEDNIQGTDQFGNQFDLFQELDAGKSVIVDVFATWCGPCWYFHNTGYLKDLYKEFGPDGNNSLVVLGVEGDAGTPVSQLTNSSLGNWLAGVEYPIIDNANARLNLSVNSYPTILLIRPDRTVMHVTIPNRYNREFYEYVLFNDATADFAIEEEVSESTFCDSKRKTIRIPVRNYGKETASGQVALMINGKEHTVKDITDLTPLRAKRVSFGLIDLEESSEIQVVVKSVNGEADQVDLRNQSPVAYNVKTDAPSEFMLKFTTDGSPGETKWELTMDGNRLQSATYTGGLAGGGFDAHKTFTYDINVGSDMGCLEMMIEDDENDGMTDFDENDPVPGVEIVDKYGNVYKPKMKYDYDFSGSRMLEFSIAPASDIVVKEGDKVSIYGHPSDPELLHEFHILNESSEGKDIRWRMYTDDNFPSTWQYYMCDGNLCYLAGLNECPEGNPNDLRPGSETKWSLHMNPLAEEGVGTVFIDLFDHNDTSIVYRTLEVTFNATTVSVKDVYTLEGLSVYPNPVRELANVNFTLEESSDVSIQMVDLTGRVLDKQYFGKQSGNVSLRYDTDRLERGMYIMQVIAGTQYGSQKVTVFK